MFKKMNIKTLTGTFIVLLVVVVLISLRDSKKGNRTFDSNLTDIDTSEVVRLVIQPKAEGDATEFKKENSIWKINIEDVWYNADLIQVNNMLGSLSNLQAKRMAANNKSRWDEFEVTDSAGTRVQFFGSKKPLVDIYVGKFSFQQGPPSQNPYQRQQNIMTTYVRLADKKEVFAVDGFLSMSFNRSSSDFRSKTVVKVDKDKLTKISMSGSSGSFNLLKEGNNWMVDGLVADSMAVYNYLNTLTRLNGSDFIQEKDLVSKTEEYSLLIEGEGLLSPIKLKAFPADTIYYYAIASSLNEGSYFNGKQSDLFEKIFIEKSKLFGEAKEEE